MRTRRFFEEQADKCVGGHTGLEVGDPPYCLLPVWTGATGLLMALTTLIGTEAVVCGRAVRPSAAGKSYHHTHTKRTGSGAGGWPPLGDCVCCSPYAAATHRCCVVPHTY